MKSYRRLIVALLVVAFAVVLPVASTNSLTEGPDIQVAKSEDSVAGIYTPAVNALFATGEIQTAVDNANPGDTIYLRAKKYYDNVDVNKDLSIIGRGIGYTIVDGQKLGSVFTIQPQVTATLTDMTIQNGQGYEGGGIENYGTTTVERCSIKNNYADDCGGGIYSEANLQVKDSQFIGNSARRNGGAIFSNYKSLTTVTNSYFNKNTAALDPGAFAIGGGAIANYAGQLTVLNSKFIDNTANSAGALYVTNGATAQIGTCVFMMNKAVGDWDSWSGLGGAIFTGYDPGSCVITNSVIASNSAKINGGGIYWDGTGTAPTTVGNYIIGNTPNNIVP